MPISEPSAIAAARRRLLKLRGVLSYCEAARLPHRATHVEQLIAEEEARLRRLLSEQHLDPADRHIRAARRQCQHCVHHCFWGACRLERRPLCLFGAVLMVETRCRLELGRACSAFRPTNAWKKESTTVNNT